MKTIGIAIVVSLFFIASTNAQQSTNSALVTNLAQILPAIERFATALDLDIPLPLTTNRVFRFTPYRGGLSNVGVYIDSRRWAFGFEPRHHYVEFADTEHCLRFVTSKPLTPAEVKALTVPSSITETQALKMASEYFARLGYDVNRLPVAPPTVRQENPFPAFTIEWPWTATEIPNASYFKMEIDGRRAKVTSFLVLGVVAETSVTNSPPAQ